MLANSARRSIRRKYSGDGSVRAGDRISALPDEVIHRILRYLPFEEVVKTSVLSKGWRFTWTNATHLAFDGKSGDCLDFGKFVRSILTRFTSPTVKRLLVTNLWYNEVVRSKLDSCLRFVKERHVEEIHLSFLAPFLYPLPESLYCLDSLVSLGVRSCCRFSLEGTVSWSRLKVLSVERVELSEDALKRIFMGSPVLESLKLSDCKSLKNLVIDASSLKELILVGNFCNVERIWAPHLLSLRISGNWWSKFSLDDVSSLVEAQLDFAFETLFKNTHCCQLVKELFEKLCRVHKITITGWCLQALSVLEMEEAPSLLLKCQNLILHAGVSQWDFPGIAYMLRNSHCLEKLHIVLTGDHSLKLRLDKKSKERFKFDEEDFLCSRKGDFHCLAKHLKRVEIAGSKAHSCGSKYLHTLIKFIHGDTHVCWRR